MKSFTALFLLLAFLPALSIQAEEERGNRVERESEAAAPSRPPVQVNRPAPAPAPARQPVVINMSSPSSGGHNRNFPSQQPVVQQPANRQPSYGQIHWPANNPTQQRAPMPSRGQAVLSNGNSNPIQANRLNPRPSARMFATPGHSAANVVHHHAYTQGYVRKKLQKIGVTAEPSYITNRAEIIHTDRQHSIIRYPQKGPDKSPLTATVLSPRHYNDEVVRDHMALVDSGDWQEKVNGLNQSELQVNHHYWHTDNGFSYCHYIDNSGYNWYGWYVGDQDFWTRNFDGRWWWYDSDFDRWCFWNNGFWWWQDPYHVGDLYCYNNDNYIPCNSAEDQIVVTAQDGGNQQVFMSPDGTRQVKLMTDTQDAFLYDTANPPSFDAIYLASGVQSVQFSDTSNGRPLEIILKLNDGSFDMFDGEGTAYNPGAFDADQANSDNPTNSQVLQRMDTPDSGNPNN